MGGENEVKIGNMIAKWQIMIGNASPGDKRTLTSKANNQSRARR